MGRCNCRRAGVSVIGWKPVEELALENPQFGPFLYGDCTLPLLVHPDENYELQGRERLNEGPLSTALYGFIAAEANKLLSKLAGHFKSKEVTKRRRNLEKLNERLARWIETKLSALKGMAEDGGERGAGRPGRGKRERKEHAPPARIAIHRATVPICKGVSYLLRAVAYDSKEQPVPPGRLLWRSDNPGIASVNSESGKLDARGAGLTTISVTNEFGQKSEPAMVQVHEAESIAIKTAPPAPPATVGSNRRLPLTVQVKVAGGRTIRDLLVNWKSSDTSVVTIGQDGILVGGEVGEAEVTAFVGDVASEPLEVVVEKGAAGKPKGGGRGAPRILLSGQHSCPFDHTSVFLAPTDPPVHQRPYKSDYEYNVFWVNLQHPLAEALLTYGEASLQWRTYHFQRLVDVYTTIELRDKFAESEELDVDQVLEEIRVMESTIYSNAREELFDLLYDETVDLSKIEE